MTERSDAGRDDFYVGYLPEAPSALARVTKLRVGVLILIGAVIAALIVTGQRPFAKASFEFSSPTAHTGWIQARPYPMLLVQRPGQTRNAFSRYLLVDFGKFGAPEEIAALHGQHVQLEGNLVYRDDQTMLELVAGSVEVAPTEAAGPAMDTWTEDLGQHALRGEIVDSKCFLGVMKPGNLKVHRACATRCISGGVPPVFLVRDRRGVATYFLLADEDGGQVNDRVLDHIADPLQVEGHVVRYGDVLVLRSDPATFHRVTDES